MAVVRAGGREGGGGGDGGGNGAGGGEGRGGEGGGGDGGGDGGVEVMAASERVVVMTDEATAEATTSGTLKR